MALTSFVCLLLAFLCAAAGAKPNFLVILQDDFGFDDVGFHNKDAEPFTSNITALAKEGLILDRHYTFWYCSPTRRSFLSGRNPVHHGTQLSRVTDDLDLRWTWISDKLSQVGYSSFWFGKGHTGYLSTKHLPIAHHFKDHYGYLGGAEDYSNAPRWLNDLPAVNSSVYSTDAYGAAALSVVQTHDIETPFFIYLPFQAVHTPYDLPPKSSCSCTQSNSTINQLMCDADIWVGRIVVALKERGIWDNTLIVYSSDNGGIEDGINFPLRGEKTTDFEGGLRVNAFISGGIVPKASRGQHSGALVHITDWYPTFCYLAGVDSRDDPPVPPLPYDPAHPEADIWGTQSYPGIDGVNAWELLTTPNASFNAVHSTLILSQSAMISGRYKLVTGMSHGGNRKHVDAMFPPGPGSSSDTGWRQRNGTWLGADTTLWGCSRSIFANNYTLPATPCLFDILSDPEERHDLASQQPKLVQELVDYLKLAWAKNFTARSPAALLGHCNTTCAAAHYGLQEGFGSMFPICGVPGCEVSSATAITI